jgi:NADH-quinone oxidoreductase subunit N
MWVDWAILWCFLSFLVLNTYGYENVPLLGGVYCRSTFSMALSKYLFLWTALCLWFNRSKGGGSVIEHTLLLLLCTFGQHMMVMSVDFMSFYLSLELQSFCLVILCSLNYKSISSVEAALKYFLLSAFSSAVLVFGISLVYFFLGFTDCATFVEAYVSMSEGNNAPLLVVAVWFITLSLLWKLAAAPLHMWAADVYQGVPSGITLYISTLPKVSVLGFWLNIWHTETVLLPFFAAMCLLLGAFSALGQLNIKRLFAYSSIAQMGFFLMALNSDGEGALLTHLTIYILTTMAIWGFILWPSRTPQYLWHWSSLSWTNPEAALTFCVLLMSLAGLPPVAGFVGKLGILKCTLESQQYGLVLIALASTCVTSYYYVRMIRIIYSEEAKGSGSEWSHFQTRMSSSQAYLISLITVLLCSIIWYSSPLLVYHQLICMNLNT